LLSTQQAARRGVRAAASPGGVSVGNGSDDEDEVETTITNLLEMLSSERAQRAEVDAELAAALAAVEAARRGRSEAAARAAAAAADAAATAAAAARRDGAKMEALQRTLAEQARWHNPHASHALIFRSFAHFLIFFSFFFSRTTGPSVYGGGGHHR
jgi:hypothetical protein